MTQTERDEMMIRMDERLKSIDERTAADHKELHGNGKMGLIARVQKLEDWADAKRHHYGALLVVITLVIEAAGVIYAIFKQP